MLSPDYVEAHNNLGNTLAREGRLADAIPHFERVLELDPENPGTDLDLGNVFAALGKPAQAIQHFERALQLKPEFAEAHYSLAMVLTGQGRLAEAAEHFDQAFRFKPDLLKPSLTQATRWPPRVRQMTPRSISSAPWPWPQPRAIISSRQPSAPGSSHFRRRHRDFIQPEDGRMGCASSPRRLPFPVEVTRPGVVES